MSIHTGKELEIVSHDLGLHFIGEDVQDWGIIHSNAERTEDFIDYFNKNTLKREVRFQLFELIIASYNDAIINDITNQQLNEKFLALVKNTEEEENLKVIKEYWVSIKDDDMFPVGNLL